MSRPSEVELESGADYRAWLADEHEPPTPAEVADHEDLGLDVAEWMADFLAEADRLADHFEELAS